ncbi:DUF4129 domain-containing protein [Stackebrandtia soli]|uniref:DUF4129 domain-containing protein n=1 Tax=Stackebrandtia soli TaxID=1892856 RepID=UPI0039EB1208
MDQRARRILPVIGVVVALLLLGWVSSSVNLSPDSTPIPRFEPWSEDASASPSDQESSPDELGLTTGEPAQAKTLPSWIGTVVVILAITGVVAVVGLVALLFGRHLARKRPTKWDTIDHNPASRVSTEELRDALRAGLSELEAGDDPRAAVIACWLRLERAAADADVERLASETPADLVRRLLTRHRVNDAALTRLADAYRHARYAPHDVTAGVRDEARAALAEIDAQLATEAREDRETGARS